MRTLVTSSVMLAIIVCAHAAPTTYVWWEAECSATNNFPAPAANPFKPNNAAEADVLSGGAWVGVGAQHAPGLFLEYHVDVPRDAIYAVWCRKFWKHGPFMWRIDQQQWHAIGRDVPLADSVALRLHTAASWAFLGRVRLGKGAHVMRVELTETNSPACFDCFVLADRQFHPRGRLKPGETYGRAPAGWFAFEPTPDALAASAIDLSHLNHQRAGDYGWLQRVGDELMFECEKKPVRFWGVTVCNDDYMLENDAAEYLAARLAKTGVNLVRMHVDFDDVTPNEKLDRIHYFVAAMKRRGIYVYIGFYCSAVARVRDKWNLPELQTGSSIQSLLFFYPRLQERYKAWARCLLGTTNQYTGVPLGRDKAVAGIEVMDEDNYFFWTFRPYDGVPAVAMPYLEKAYGDWLAAKYGTLTNALAAWGPSKPPKRGKDDPDAGRAALYAAGDLIGEDWAAAERNPRRAADQAQFLTEHLQSFWATMRRWLRDEFGFGGVVVGTNWKTADERVLGPLDKYTLTAGDATAENNYFGPDVQGQPPAFPFAAGNYYDDMSALTRPINPVLMTAQVNGMPHLWTEGQWHMPNRFRTEAMLLLAGYFSLQGVDGLMLFTLERDWCGTLPKWPVQTPACLGQFPAAALMYRAGYIKQGPVVVREALPLASLYQLEGSSFGKPAGLDEFQAVHVPGGAATGVKGGALFDPLAFYAGRVTRVVGEQPGTTMVSPQLPSLIDRQAKRVTSVTRELTLDYGAGVMTIDAPCAQGVNGFLARAGRVATKDLTIQSSNDYGVIVVVSLDGKPLASSTNMLVQAMTEEQNFGYATTTTNVGAGAAANLIAAIGYPPIVVREINGMVRFTRPDAATLEVTALDSNGYPVKRVGTADAVTLEPATLYYLISKKH